MGIRKKIADLAFQIYHWADPEAQYIRFSYSQTGEDLIVKHIFNSLNIKHPSYLDIGAHHPLRLNNTALFYHEHSKGVNIEPNPFLVPFFYSHRPLDINLNLGISTSTGEADFYIMSSSLLSTFSKEEAQRYVDDHNKRIKEIRKMEVTTYDNIIHKYFDNKAPDFLSLDVEGIDEDIIRSIDYQKHPPLVICVETISYSDSGQGVKQQGIIDFLKEQDYLLFADTNINSIFVLRNAWERNEA